MSECGGGIRARCQLADRSFVVHSSGGDNGGCFAGAWLVHISSRPVLQIPDFLYMTETEVFSLTRDPAISPLFQELARALEIRFEPSRDRFWSVSPISGGKVTIRYAPYEVPAAAFAHELLHLELQLSGYRRIYSSVSSLDNGSGWWSRFVNDLDNFLQHVRIFPRFLDMGFAPKHFGSESADMLRAELETRLSDRNVNPRDYVNTVLTLLGAQHSLPEEEFAGYMKRVRGTHAGAYARKLDSITSAVREWEKATGYDAEETIRRIIRSIRRPTQTWLGYSPDPGTFPDGGFFVDDRFRPQDFRRSR